MPSSRLPALDMLRGFAVMGILWMNITAFALPQSAYFNPAASGPLSAGDIAFWAVSLIAVDGKMRALFAMLFGASILLLIDREEMVGRNGRRTQAIRLAWLFVIGLAHYLLLWWGDILMIYALVGVAAMLFAGREPLSLVKTAFLLFLLQFLLSGSFIASLYAWGHGAAAPGASADMRQGFNDFMASLSNPASPAIVAETALYRSGFSAIFTHKLGDFPGQWLWGLPFTALETLGFMLLGMAMLKGGFLTARWQPEQYLRTARHCFLIGLPPMVLLAGWIIWHDFAPLPTFAVALLWSLPFRIPLAVGWASLLIYLYLRAPTHPFFARVTAAGRMTLSNYLGTSLLMTFLFYGWGLGLFGTIRPALLTVFVVGGSALMLLCSKPYADRFAIGPAEWIWRSLALGRPQKIRKSG